jgi:hypothetical protein
MADSSGHGATGAYTPQVTLSQAGPLPSELIAAARGAPSLPLAGQPRTVEGWVNTTDSGPDFLAGYGQALGAEGFSVSIDPTDVTVSGYEDDLVFTSPAALNDGSWHFVVATTTRTSATVYVDGTSLGTQTFPTPLDTLAAPEGLEIGAPPQGCCGYFTGGLADIAVFPTALTAAQVTAQFTASGRAPPRQSHSRLAGRPRHGGRS